MFLDNFRHLTPYIDLHIYHNFKYHHTALLKYVPCTFYATSWGQVGICQSSAAICVEYFTTLQVLVRVIDGLTVCHALYFDESTGQVLAQHKILVTGTLVSGA